MVAEKQPKPYSEPSYAQSDKKKTDYPWYLENIDMHLIPETQELLEKYSKIPPDQQSKHVHKTRDQAWEIRSYPCTGNGAFLIPTIALSSAYPKILSCLQSGGKIMDVGSFIGMDLRRLVFDGAPSGNMYGVDIVSHWDVGFDFFNDKDHFKGKFIEADIMSDGNPDLEELKGDIDVICISAVLHQWDWDPQVECCKKLVSYSKPGTLIIGYQIGNPEGRQYMLNAPGGAKIAQWRHDSATWKDMWKQVGEETGTKWEAEGRISTWESMKWDPAIGKVLQPGDCPFNFVVTRVE